MARAEPLLEDYEAKRQVFGRFGQDSFRGTVALSQRGHKIFAFAAD